MLQNRSSPARLRRERRSLCWVPLVCCGVEFWEPLQRNARWVSQVLWPAEISSYFQYLSWNVSVIFLIQKFGICLSDLILFFHNEMTLDLVKSAVSVTFRLSFSVLCTMSRWWQHSNSDFWTVIKNLQGIELILKHG